MLRKLSQTRNLSNLVRSDRCDSHKSCAMVASATHTKSVGLSILNSQIHDEKPHGLLKIQTCDDKLRDLSKFSRVRRATREFVTFPILSAVTGAIHKKVLQESHLLLTGKVCALRV